MFDTYVTIVGNVLTAPEWRRTTQSNTLVANFKVASTARRLDRDSKRWVDGNSLRVRVNCWRKLAEGVAASVMVGDPVVVVGRMYTRDWVDGDGNHRAIYELEAVAVGHDLSRGRGRFLRNRPSTQTSSLEDAEAATRVHGEESEAVPDSEAPAVLDPLPYDDEDEPDFSEVPVSPAPGSDPLRALRGGGFPVAPTARLDATVPDRTVPLQAEPDGAQHGDMTQSPAASEAIPADPAAAGQNRPEPAGAESGRVRRGRAKAPVPA